MLAGMTSHLPLSSGKRPSQTRRSPFRRRSHQVFGLLRPEVFLVRSRLLRASSTSTPSLTLSGVTNYSLEGCHERALARARASSFTLLRCVCVFFERNTRRHDLFHGGNEKSSPRRCVVVTFIGLVPSLSGYAIAHRWRVLPRIGRHRASSSQSSSINPGSFLFR